MLAVATEPQESDEADASKPMRIAKWLARAGVCSRRTAEEWIAQGRVQIDGKRITTPASFVAIGQSVKVNGKVVAPPQAPRLWIYHKPQGVIVSSKDDENRPTFESRLPKDMPRVVTVGRLDVNSEGLLLLTNHGGLARYLELPQTGWARRYRVRVYGALNDTMLEPLRNGVTVEGVHYRPMIVAIERQLKSNSWLQITLREGKNREIRRCLQHINLHVTRLLRTHFGPFALGNLEKDQVREITTKAMRNAIAKEAWEKILSDS